MNHKENNKKTEKIGLVFIFTAFLLLNYCVFIGENSVIAQGIGGGLGGIGGGGSGGGIGGGMGGGTTGQDPTLIGGETLGISDSEEPLCCNGIKLEFSSIAPSNSYIVDEGTPVLWAFGTTDSYDHGNEFTEGYYTVGLLKSSQCLTIESECEESEDIPEIQVIGTGAAEAGGGIGL